MTDHCSPTFDQLAHSLGFSCDTAGGIVELRNPFGLENWTLPVLEATVILGSILMLIHAVRRLRRDGDATNLALWFGALAYLFVIEPPLYFPAAFGISGHVDTMFAHNVFSVDFLWGRLPLYIVAIYPFMATLAYEIVRMLGVFQRYGLLTGATCVGFVHHAFYEIFDQLGPQLRWWEWTTHNPLNQPMFDSVPLPSVVVFATLWPMSLALCVYYFVGRHADRGRRFSGIEITWRTVVIGLLASLGTFILPLPATVFGAGSDTVRGVLYAAELIIITAVAVPLLYRRWKSLRTDDNPLYRNNLVRYYSVAYLLVFAILWITALPDFFGATGGLTKHGDPIGDLWYTLACFVVGIACAAATFTVSTPVDPRRDANPALTAGKSPS